MAKKFDIKSLSIVAAGLLQDNIPFDNLEFVRSLDKAIRSIEGLGATPQDFEKDHNNPDDPFWKIGAYLAKKDRIGCCGQAFTELRRLRNRLKRLRMRQHTLDDIDTLIVISYFVCDSALFVETA